MWVLFALLRGVANVCLTFAFFYGVWWYLFTWMPENDRQTFDPIYARDVFAARLPVAEVLAHAGFTQKMPRPGTVHMLSCDWALMRHYSLLHGRIVRWVGDSGSAGSGSTAQGRSYL
jgi:hypothetical protein